MITVSQQDERPERFFTMKGSEILKILHSLPFMHTNHPDRRLAHRIRIAGIGQETLDEKDPQETKDVFGVGSSYTDVARQALYARECKHRQEFYQRFLGPENAERIAHGGDLHVDKTKLSSITVVIIDWSGVISNDIDFVYHANQILCSKYGLPESTFEKWRASSKGSCYEYLVHMGLTDVEEDIIKREFAELLTSLRKQGHGPVVYPEAHTFFRMVQNRKVFVVSTHPQDHLEQEALEYGVHQHIERFYGSASDKALHITELIEAEGVDRESVIFMGDMISDIRAAKRAGVRSVGITTGYHTYEQLDAEEPDLIVESLIELVDFLNL